MRKPQPSDVLRAEEKTDIVEIRKGKMAAVSERNSNYIEIFVAVIWDEATDGSDEDDINWRGAQNIAFLYIFK